MTVQLPGYLIEQAIYTGAKTLVYRGRRRSDKQRVVIKFLRNDYPTFTELLQFRNQYTITKNLNIPGILRPEALESYGNSYALVMKDDGSISLQEYTQIHDLELTEILTIAAQIAKILHDVHQNRIIHKDIKPANILIHPQTKEIQLIDFSIASLLPKETQEIRSPELLEGTAAYVAPEQTGRMNRGIDYRADFYALGVTLFELLAGQLPFPANDLSSLVHSHVAKAPPSLTAYNIPETIANIVNKLLFKNAEDRYQSALGLLYDLENCLHQLRETGKIEKFELATRDLCDRFLIPEKLYGRETEVRTLLDAFERVDRGSVELLLVSGFSGIGKTSIINEVHRPIARQQGYFIKGKFDQFNRNIPFSAFVQAFRELMGQLISESNAKLAAWQAKILDAVGDNGQIIIDVIPELEIVIGKQPPVLSLNPITERARFKVVFKKFISVFTTSQHPLVIFLDDLQWADSASLNLLQLLMSKEISGKLLTIGAYRDNEVFAAHPLMQALEEIQKSQCTVKKMTIEPLPETTIYRLVADTLSCSYELAQPLAQLVYQKTQGNPFFTNQFLKALHDDGWIRFTTQIRADAETPPLAGVPTGAWQCDISAVRQLALTSNVVEFMALQLQKLPLATQKVLKLAACIGDRFDLNTLAIVAEESPIETATNLWEALQEGSIVPISETYKFFRSNDSDDRDSQLPALDPGKIAVPYKFLHDRVQQAAYSLIPDDRKQATHLQIGRLLLQNTSVAERDEKIFEIVNQLNAGRELIAEQSERDELAQLNAIAGYKAKAATACAAAVKYFTIAIELLGADSWTRQYDLMLDFHLAAAEAEYLNSNFDRSEFLAQIALQQAKTLLEQARIYEVKINACIVQVQLQKAIDTGLQMLEMLGVKLEAKPPKIEEISALIDLPEITDLEKLAALRILNVMGRAAYVTNPQLSQQNVFTAVHLCMRYGNSPFAALVYGFYGLMLCGIMADFDAGYEFSQLSLRLVEKFDCQDFKSITISLFNGYVRHWKEHIKTTIEPLKEAFYSGIESGELVYAGYSILNHCQHSFFAGELLGTVEQKQREYIDLLSKQKLEYHVNYGRVCQQTCLNLLGVGAVPPCPPDRLTLTGTAFDEKSMLPVAIEQNNGTTLFAAYVMKSLLAYLFEEPELALANAKEAANYEQASVGLLIATEHNFYYSLALLACYPRAAESEQNVYLQQVAAQQAKMQMWADRAPMNFLHKWQLVEAEKSRVLGQKIRAIELYNMAVKGAKANEYIQEAALANELAAKFYLEWGRESIAAGFMQSAYYCYAKWGAKAKIDEIEKRYSQLLQPIFQKTATLNLLENLANSSAHLPSISASRSTDLASSSTINNVIDFTSIVKASQVLSSTIKLDELLRQLTQIILQYSGGDRCVLILPNNKKEWEVRAIATSETTELCTQLLESNSQLPIPLVQYIKNTEQLVVVDELETDLPVMCDYFYQQQPQSVLCLPILNQGKLRGILYLENRLTSGVFASDRILVLNFLCTQAAISLENARLYQQAQDYAQQLEQSQLQLVQNEKMSALGNLVAGVAHEINNPIGFISGNLNETINSVQDLTEFLQLEREKFDNPDAEIEEKADKLDIEYLMSDLPKMLQSMKMGCDRLKNISTSLRTFSRADKEDPILFNIHEGIDSTLVILKHRLKANENRPDIEIITEYGKLPMVECFPGQLNQVFMNIIANAIDALDESNIGRSFNDIAANPNRITIRTQVKKQQIKITIADNGKGMPAEVESRIFDHLFTTKPVGKGTGLGLAIARQIIVEKHGGLIQVNSELGEGTEFAIVLPVAIY